MKRSFYGLLVLFLLLPAIACYADKTVNITVTKGSTFVLEPYKDLGHAYTDVWEGVPSYTISDESAFFVVPESHQFYVTAIEYFYYFTYTFTAIKNGNYTFSESITVHNNNGYFNSERMTYNITVVEVTAISMASALSIFVGEQEQLIPTIIQVGAVTNLTWNSSNTSVATVSTDGIVSATSPGTTIITCTATNGVSSQCEVTVSPVFAKSITLSQTEATLFVGNKQQLTTTIFPENTTDKSVIWSSSNETVAVITERGQVMAVGNGYCLIRATANDGSGKFASCLVTVQNKEESKLGDVNGDGTVDIGDIITVIDIMTSQTSPSRQTEGSPADDVFPFIWE